MTRSLVTTCRKKATSGPYGQKIRQSCAGHGSIDREAGYYLATHDADPLSPATTALSGKELITLLEGVKARTVLALDTCRSGGLTGGDAHGTIVTGPGDLSAGHSST